MYITHIYIPHQHYMAHNNNQGTEFDSSFDTHKSQTSFQKSLNQKKFNDFESKSQNNNNFQRNKFLSSGNGKSYHNNHFLSSGNSKSHHHNNSQNNEYNKFNQHGTDPENYSQKDSQHDNTMEYELSPEEIRLRILNEKNIPITEEFINGIFERLGFDHKVKNLENFQRAMVHSSYLEKNVNNSSTIKSLKDVIPMDPELSKTCMPLQPDSYERLEFLGDSIIRHGIGKYLYMRFPLEAEGFLTTNRSKLENKFALSDLARKFGIQNYAVIAKNVEMLNGRTSIVTLTEDIFEAFVGALNLEIDENKTVEFIWLIIEKELDMSETIRTQSNYKDQLMQYFHKFDVMKKHELQYNDSEIESSDGKKRFRTFVCDKENGKKLGVGTGRSKKMSQQRAAKDALIKLGLIGKEIEVEEFFECDGNIEEEIKKVRAQP